MQCTACGFESPDGMNFCGQCGATLRAPARESAAGPTTEPAERRQLTLLFCDLVDSTTLAARLDPEELRDVVRGYQSAVAEVIRRFGGHVAQYLGDGVLVYYGFPQAHEDDAQRAVHTGLGILSAIRGLNDRLRRERDIELAVRVGVHTGPVVAGTIGDERSEERLAVGQAPNIAARLQDLAARNTVVLSTATYHLVQGIFACVPLGPQSLKGLAEPLDVYRVVRETGARTRFDVAVGRTLSPLVGRQAEVALLVERFDRAVEGRAQAVLVRGEAGIGKSRLIHAFRERLAVRPGRWLASRCSPYHQNTAFHPLTELLEHALGIDPAASGETRLRTLETAIQARSLDPSAMVPFLAVILSVPVDERYPVTEAPPQEQREQIFQVLADLVETLAEGEPLVISIEDLHWMDPSTLEFLTTLVRRRAAHVLAVFSCRPSFDVPWERHPDFAEIVLERLTDGQVRSLIETVTGGASLPPAVVQQVVDRTDGVPLFVEELSKMVIETGLAAADAPVVEPGAVTPPPIPATLQESLIARLDRLATARSLAQLAAVLGREFRFETLRAVATVDDDTLRRDLDQLVAAQLLYQGGTPPDATYAFKHALIQDAAYGLLLKSTRRQYHRRVAEVLAVRSGADVDVQPEVLAYHYTEAGFGEEAIDSWLRAGKRAMERGGNLEAVSHIQRALALLPELPEGTRDQRELVLRTALGPALIATKGYTHPDVEQSYTRALELCQRLGDAEAPELFWDLWGLGAVYQARAELRRSLEVGRQLMRLARDDSALLMEGHFGVGSNLLFLGDLRAAASHLEQGIAYRALLGPDHVAPAGVDTGLACRIYTALLLWQLGYPEQAITRSRETMTDARDAHAFQYASCLALEAFLHQARGEPTPARDRSDAAIGLSREGGFAVWLAWAVVTNGWAKVRAGEAEEGMVQMRRELDSYRENGDALFQTYLLGALAEVFRDVGSVHEARRTVLDAIDAAERTDERFWEPELFRLRGTIELEASQRNDTEAEAAFQTALERARAQEAKSLELRAAVSLGQLWRRQGRGDDARTLVSDVYEWFTEGFDTVDLRNARAFLDEAL